MKTYLELSIEAVTGTENASKRYKHKVTLDYSEYKGFDSLVLRINNTPGSWFLSTLFENPKPRAMLYIDAGQGWACFNIESLLTEVKLLILAGKIDRVTFAPIELDPIVGGS